MVDPPDSLSSHTATVIDPRWVSSTSSSRPTCRPGSKERRVSETEGNGEMEKPGSAVDSVAPFSCHSVPDTPSWAAMARENVEEPDGAM